MPMMWGLKYDVTPYCPTCNYVSNKSFNLYKTF